MNKIFLFIFLLTFLLVNNSVYAQSQAAQYLCELGVSAYKEGKYDEAISAFKKVLMLEPENKIAKEYTNKIFQRETSISEIIQVESATKAEIKETVKESIKKESIRIEEPTYRIVEKKLTREEAMDKALIDLKKEAPKEKSFISKEREGLRVDGLKITGETQISLGVTANDSAIWKRANADLNERNWRMFSTAAYDNRENTYDPRIFDRLKVNMDTQNSEGFNFHSNITADPWSFIGKSEKITITSTTGLVPDTAEFELKYWSNTGYTINQTVYTLVNGAAINIPEMKVYDFQTKATPVTNTWGQQFTIPALKIQRNYNFIRELWFDYTQPDSFKFRFFPIAYQDQALTFDDPLRLSNNHIWWEESPWLRRWLPGRLNPGAAPDDFSPGQWDRSLAFFTRDSDGTRLTALRGASFEYTPTDDIFLTTTFASPKDLWQDYDTFDNLINATRFKYHLLDNLSIGSVYTYRLGLNENKRDYYNHLWGTDIGYEPIEGTKLSLEVATSRSKADLTSPNYATESRGNAYYFSVVGTFPRRSVMDLKYGYDEIKPEKSDKHFTKYRLYGAHMDWGFESPLSNYIETRDDTFWSRHIHFRKPFQYFYGGFPSPALKWEDIEPFRIGNGIDIGRDVLGFRLENSLWDRKIDNLFDVRNVHDTNGDFIENVARDEITYKATDRLTTKLLGIYHKLPKTTAGYDPFIVDGDTGQPLLNSYITEGKNVSLKTGSLGIEYAFTDWLALSGIWERTNDYSLAYDNYPRGNLNDSSFTTVRMYDRIYRLKCPFLYAQDLFPLPPYPYYDIFKAGLRLNPLENLEIYLDYTRNEFKSAGQIDDNINHIGLEIAYLPTKKLGFYTRYTYSRWNDLNLMRQGYSKYYLGHHNFFSEFKYMPTSDDELIMQYGESGRSPVAMATTDPFGGSLMTLDTQHIFRMYYRRKF